MTRIKRRMPAALLLMILVLLLAACGKKPEGMVKVTRSSLYTLVSMTVVTNDEAKAQQAIENAYKELDRLERLLNFYADDSELSEINRNAGVKPVKVSPEAFEVIEKAVFTSEMTEGAFDVTVGPLVNLWDFKKGVIPEKDAIAESLKRVGYRNIVLDKSAVTVYLKKSGAQMDLGGILKGYAADKATHILQKHGFLSGIVSVGGEVRAFGKKPDATPWIVGIQNPRQKGQSDEVIATIAVSDKALSTSGDYIRFFEKDGSRYHHLLNSRTGYPAEQCGSVTIVADDGVTADGFAKVFILGPEKGLSIAKKAGFDALFIDCSGKIVMSDGLQTKITLLKP
ncbi:MAG TPA: FAD:protein FMN transferase [Dissulfurispiraceae bacterium]|nr:FAD:protein FMN transferase [Dissulfurispiraceae bacterium]